MLNPLRHPGTPMVDPLKDWDFLSFCFFFFFNFFNVYLLLRDRDRQSMSRGGAERWGDTECEGGSRLRAVSTEPDVGLKLTNR